MDKFLELDKKERREVFQQVSFERHLTIAIVEKDFWVTWILHKIFNDPSLSKLFVFKGGTSLSKVFHLIERFSEDIDLILDWRKLTQEEPAATRSKTKQDKFNKELLVKAEGYIKDVLFNQIQSLVQPYCTCDIDKNSPYAINIKFPGTDEDTYLRSEILLEIGPLASWFPSKKFEINSIVSSQFPHLFSNHTFKVTAICAERTFWEKATILHHEAYRPAENVMPTRYSRHYYDLSLLAHTNIKDLALESKELLENVVDFKMQFYARGWANYEAARAGDIKLIPPEHRLKALKSDYLAMRNMIYGQYFDFENIIETLKSLEEQIRLKFKVS